MATLYEAYAQLLDSIEKEYKLSESNNSPHKFSTGVLSIDLVIGGGLVVGTNFIVSGMEQSAKSTLAMHCLGSFLKYDVPVIDYHDPENSVDAVYTGNILRIKLADLVGQRDASGKWINLPRIRHYQDNVIETVFDSTIKLLNRLPDKKYRSEDGEYYYIVDKKDPRQKGFAEALNKTAELNSTLSKSEFLWYYADPSPQALVIVDSYAAMVAESEDEKEERGKAMALEARLFSQNLRRLVCKIRRKAAIVFGTNQLREKPGVMFGSPIYETGGNALKFYSTNRNRLAARAVPEKWKTQGSSQVSTEPSVEGKGEDIYAYKLFTNVKNKHASPFGECWTRVWVKDYRGQGRGFDPVFDLAEMFQMMKLATVSNGAGGKKIKFWNMPDEFKPFSNTIIDWLMFKTIVLAGEGSSRDVRLKAAEFLKANKLPIFPFRAKALKLLSSGKASAIYHANKSDKSSAKGEE